MSETEATFQTLIERVRAGDERAAEELVRRYEPMVRRAARVRLADPRLRQVLDSVDICQSVMASFFVRAALGQYELNEPDQLLRLLATMARNKLANQARGQRAARRDCRRVEAGALEAGERQVLDVRQAGKDWAEVAAAVGGSPEALRMKRARAVRRAAREIGLDDPDDA
ncbi:MAG: ECF-type sigma factor [Isosphaeraceae bacterium]|nr:ECF-type sigma factor [Isosphaeraceae bacterium]